MKIRTKTSIIIIVSVVCMVLLSQLSLEYYINKDIHNTETRETRSLLERIGANVNHEIDNINLTDYSWSNWDDTYYFVQDHNQKYINDNFNDSMLASYNLNIMVYLNRTGNNVFDLYYNLSTQYLESFPADTLSILIGDRSLQDHSEAPSISGIMNLPEGPCIISAWSILTSNSSGPSAGTLIFGKYLDTAQQRSLSIACGTPLTVCDIAGKLDNTQTLAKGYLQTSDFYINDGNESIAQVYSVMNDIHGQPSFLLTSQLPREAFQQGSSSLTIVFAETVIIGLAMIIVSLFLINNVVLSRVTRLEDDVKKIEKGGPNGGHLTLSGRDEIFSLSEEINSMIDSIERRSFELRESEARYKSIMEQSVVAIFIVDLEQEAIVRVNPAFENLFGYSREEIKGIGLSSISTSDSLSIGDILKGVSKEHPVVGREVTLRNRRGEDLDVEISGSEIEYEGHRALSVIAWDVTERHRLERELARNQKLESLGVLAGGIAHDFNNMLASIVSNIEIAKGQSDNELSKQRLDESVRSAMRAKHLTQQLLTFSKGGQPIKEVLDLAPLLHQSTEFVLAGSNVTAEYSIDQDLGNVNADPVQIEQVINNLVINAVQSMPDGGHLDIKASNMPDDETDILVKPGKYVRIDVKDEGIGIPAKDLERIFDPFYTTKEKGSGLGLSTVRSIVKNHGGVVLVESKPANGTTFSVILPSALGEGCARPTPNTLAVEVASRGRILVMDDEEPILDVLRIMLEDFGHDVVCVRTGEEATIAYRDALAIGSPFNSVIMDLTIKGGMGGKDAIKAILALNPKARVIVSSGYSNDPIMANPHEYGFWDILSKPFSMQDLSSKISRAMSELDD